MKEKNELRGKTVMTLLLLASPATALAGGDDTHVGEDHAQEAQHGPVYSGRVEVAGGYLGLAVDGSFRVDYGRFLAETRDRVILGPEEAKGMGYLQGGFRLVDGLYVVAEADLSGVSHGGELDFDLAPRAGARYNRHFGPVHLDVTATVKTWADTDGHARAALGIAPTHDRVKPYAHAEVWTIVDREDGHLAHDTVGTASAGVQKGRWQFGPALEVIANSHLDHPHLMYGGAVTYARPGEH